jgi:asparagine synthase (glutamine-hydrolysing)
MCGIAGIFAFHPGAPPPNPGELLRLGEAMARRGPDGSGSWISSDGRVALAHRRLAILDPAERAAQPMRSEDGRLAIVYNGAIYNYRSLRRSLELRGHRFRTSGDTEVILALYREKGADLVRDLRGMFAFALHDAERGGILLARDPFGIKPLYLAGDGRTLRFASQVKALLAGGGADTTPDPAGRAGFLLWGCVPEPHTLVRGIRAFPAGATLWVDAGGVRAPSPFFDLRRELRDAEAASSRGREASPREDRARLREAMRDTLRHHLVSDVPVGLFLSAGLDSSTLAALAGEEGAGDLRALTLGVREFRGTPEDETLLAGQTAARRGIGHEIRWLSRAEFLSHLEDALKAMDQPSVDGLNSYFISKAAAEAGLKVALSGVGGDELFGGYPSFRQVPRLARALAPARFLPGLGRGLRWTLLPLLGERASPKAAGLVEYGSSMAGAYLLRRALFLPWELPALLGEETAREGLDALRTVENLEATLRGLRRNRARIAALEISWYLRNQLLRDADWAGMAHGLEIRAPLVDIDLFRALAPLLAGPHPPGKREMAAVAEPPLPPELLRRPKSGFRLPLREWLDDSPAPGGRERGLRAWALRIAGLDSARPGGKPARSPARTDRPLQGAPGA